MKTNFSLGTLSSLGIEEEYDFIYNNTDPKSIEENYSFTYNNTERGHDAMNADYGRIAIYSFICVFCIFGLMGNGIVIWLLGFRIKRNPFTTYILNLSIADFGLLISLLSIFLVCSLPSTFVEDDGVYREVSAFIAWEFFQLMYSSGQLLLTVISIDRCMAVLFPIWHRCHRPTYLSPALCIVIWAIFFLNCAIDFTNRFDWFFLVNWCSTEHLPYMVNSLLCLPLITLSTLILLIRMCFKSQQHKRGKILKTIVITLVFFLIFAFPLNVSFLIHFYDCCTESETCLSFLVDTFVLSWPSPYYLTEYGLLCACLNSCVNPLIYYLVGRHKRGRSRQSMKVILQTAFMDDQVCGEQVESPAETQL
ncbi:mas-related G-protein coupled receptor member H-like [Rhineura floridana]|uniref:mas-related G-protein coupled receptor member H-like n=1 Tax=Rhineura floridana TaxID=261503 RepID=UPI002AC7FA88|nr:mas-related G-protein coupled receptor member H-like [Rhineura floridana]XP_061463857.1 mas-related G-protein coupled receptor member H-like [Rhineura floridana]